MCWMEWDHQKLCCSIPTSHLVCSSCRGICCHSCCHPHQEPSRKISITFMFSFPPEFLGLSWVPYMMPSVLNQSPSLPAHGITVKERGKGDTSFVAGQAARELWVKCSTSSSLWSWWVRWGMICWDLVFGIGGEEGWCKERMRMTMKMTNFNSAWSSTFLWIWTLQKRCCFLSPVSSTHFNS